MTSALLQIVKNKNIKWFSTYSYAIMRDIDNLIGDRALRLEESNEKLNVELAKTQHDFMKTKLKSIGLDVIQLNSGGFPDSVFIEDTAVIIDNTVLITNPGAISRRPEVEAIRSFFINFQHRKLILKEMLKGGYLDGGDVLFTGKDIFVGISSRTNSIGVESVKTSFPNYNVVSIDLKKLLNNYRSKTLHLKSFCSMGKDNTIITGGEIGKELQKYINKLYYNKYEFINTPDEAAANCLYINNHLLKRSDEEFPKSKEIFDSFKLNKIDINSSELSKVDGALTCCVLLIK